jgi:hypothetical protein
MQLDEAIILSISLSNLRCRNTSRRISAPLHSDIGFAVKVPYLDPPAHSLVLSVDEKSQIQALDRTQPGLPMKKGRAGQ